VLPFWFVSLGRVARLVHTRRAGAVAVVVVALIGNVAALRHHPHHLAYFNELTGGPAHGGEYLIDSNLDWGQDLKNLAAWLRAERPGESVGLAYFGGVDPSILEASGEGFPFRLAPAASADLLQLRSVKPESRAWRFLVRWEEENRSALHDWIRTNPGRSPLTMPALRESLGDSLGMPASPQPGLFAVSANFVYGLPFRIHDEDGNVWSAGAAAFGYFRRLTPIAKIGYSIFVYDVSPGQAKQARREMGFQPDL
ncbi:MAG: hypothetical protein ACREQY_16235, partial [Candidatus Binatia bacterium]